MWVIKATVLLNDYREYGTFVEHVRLFRAYNIISYYAQLIFAKLFYDWVEVRYIREEDKE